MRLPNLAYAALAAGSIGWAAAALAQVVPQAEPEAAPGKLPKCVSVRSEARYSGFGYDHVVEIANGCDKAVDCRVSTSVNPQPAQVRVTPGQSQSVMTFRGSPAREFQADVECKLKP